MKQNFTLLFIFFMAFSVRAQLDGPAGALIDGNYTQQRYDPAKLIQLQEAYQAMRAGQWQLSEQRYEATLVNNPDWVPGLVGLAELMGRTGRQNEARVHVNRASRADPVATGFLMSSDPRDLLRYLAPYPVVEDFIPVEGLPQVGNDTRNRESIVTAAGNFEQNGVGRIGSFDYFDAAFAHIQETRNTSQFIETLKLFVAGEFLEADRVLRDPQGYYLTYPALLSFERGNLAMLMGNYLQAVDHYDRTKLRLSEDWPEAMYNRGLANILLKRYDMGCQMLQRAATLDYLPAQRMMSSLCSF